VTEGLREVSSHPLARRAVLAVAIGTGYLVWLLSDLGTARLRLAVSDAVFVVVPLVAAHACLAAHRRQPTAGAAWKWIGAGCVTWAGASLAFATYQVVLDRVAPIPSLADVGYIGYAFPIAVGVLRLPRVPGNVWSRWRTGLDCLVVAAALLLTSAVLVLGPIFRVTELTSSQGVVALCYPLVDVLVAAAVLSRCVVLPDARRLVWVPLSLGLLTLSLTDSVYVVGNLRGTFAPGGPLDVGWFAAFALVGLAASASGHLLEDTHERAHAPSFTRQLLPSAAIGVAALSCAVHPDVLARHTYWWLIAAVAACVAVRTVVVVADQTTLARDLSRAVDRRTAQLRHREQWWQDIVQNLSDVVIVVARDGSIAYCSPAVNAALGHMPLVRGAQQLISQVHPDDESAVRSAVGAVAIAGTSPRGFVECRIRRADGSYGWFEVEAVGQLSELALEGAVLTLHDVTERRELTDRLQRQALHDALTGLPNRTVLMDRIDEAFREAPHREFGLLLLDLDDFKVINDRHGHAAGDVVLTVIARRLAETVRSDDTVVRLGGDEFAYLVHGTAADVRGTAEQLVEAVQRPVVTNGRRFVVRTSVGAVLADGDGSDSAAALLSHADIALYDAKARGKGGIVLIEGASRADAAQQVLLKEQIAQPDLAQFSVVYQPVVDLQDGTMRGVEALLRWNHPDLGPIPPDLFIPMAEHGGSISTLGRFVLEQACRQVAAWSREAPAHRLSVGVNVSIRQLDEPGFAQAVGALVTSCGVEPNQVVVELTEQSIAIDFETAVSVVGQLRAIGASVAVDDYGTGYSSLRYLHRFDADVVKVDRSFVAHVVESPHTQKIVRSVMHMAQSLNLQSVAEGIETEEQLAVVRSLGCELGQGYLFSRPVPPGEISAMLQDPRPLAVTGGLRTTA